MSMTNPENLFQRGTAWWIRYSVNGEKIRRSLKTTSVREAKRLRDQILGKRTAAAEVREAFGIASPGDDGAPVPTVRVVAERFLTYEEGRGNKREITAAKLRGLVTNWIIPELGADRLITAIGFEDIELFLGRVRRSKKKKGSGRVGKTQVAMIFQATSRLFRYAVRRGIAPSNPCELLERGERPSRGPAKSEFLTWEEIERLLAKLGDSQLTDMVYLACYTGLRWGEVAGLAFDDLDLAGTPPTLTPRRSFTGPLKNAASGQAIELHPEAAALLRVLKASGEGPWVFPSQRGTPHKRLTTAKRDQLHAAAAAAGITKHVTPHIFRHSFGTHLYAASRDLHLVKRAMRHSAIEVTLRVYAHDTGASMAAAVADLPSIGRQKLRSV
jgi:integrase